MDIHLDLSKADAECLLAHLPVGSGLRERLRQSDTIPSSVGLPLGESNPFVCSEGDARALLRIASEYCSGAFPKIKEGMKLGGVTVF